MTLSELADQLTDNQRPERLAVLCEDAAERLRAIAAAWEAIDLAGKEFIGGGYGPLTMALKRAIEGAE